MQFHILLFRLDTELFFGTHFRIIDFSALAKSNGNFILGDYYNHYVPASTINEILSSASNSNIKKKSCGKNCII
jgi:hypothetical protein